jgi:hypothetical protein
MSSAKHPQKDSITAAFSCNVCYEILCIPMYGSDPSALSQKGDLDSLMSAYGFRRRACTYPAMRKGATPEHLSNAAKRAFEQARFSEEHKQTDAAAAMYRKAIDVVTRELDEDSASLVLQKRIERLHAAGRITENLKDYAHIVRIDGNRGAHDDEELSVEELKELGRFTELFLTYAVTMPTAVEIRKQAAQAAKQAASA